MTRPPVNDVAKSEVAAVLASIDPAKTTKRKHVVPGMTEFREGLEARAKAALASLPSLGTKKVATGEVAPRSGFFNRIESEFSGDQWETFVADIASTGGNHTPVVVIAAGANRYEIIDGERRWRACQRNMLDVLIDVREATTDEQKATIERMFVSANEQRADRSYASKCLLMVETAKRLGNLSQRELAAAIGTPLGTVAVRLAHAPLVEIIKPIISDLDQGGFRDFSILAKAEQKSGGKLLRRLVDRQVGKQIPLAVFLRDVRVQGGTLQPNPKPRPSLIKPTASGFRCDLPKLNPEQLKLLEEFLAGLLNGKAP